MHGQLCGSDCRACWGELTTSEPQLQTINMGTGLSESLSWHKQLQVVWGRQQYSAKDWVRPGKQLREAGLRPKHPAVIVPGNTLCYCSFTGTRFLLFS